MKNIRLRGVQMHIGSQLTDVKPLRTGGDAKFCRSSSKLAEKYELEFFSIGGGLGIIYESGAGQRRGELVEIFRCERNFDAGEDMREKLLPLLEAAWLENFDRAGPFHCPATRAFW